MKVVDVSARMGITDTAVKKVAAVFFVINQINCKIIL